MRRIVDSRRLPVGSRGNAEREVLSAECGGITRRRASSRSSLITHRSAFLPGFTLVELLMVLIIVGILVSLLTVAVSYAIRAAKQAFITTEISQLDATLQGYKNDNGGLYPPCMAIPMPSSSTPTSPSRIDLFNQALRKRFPRYTGDYVATRTLLLSTAWKVTPIGGGTPSSLNLDRLDAAEALVFWLAGPPAPTSASSSTILYGFSSNPTTPFDTTTSSRSKILFSFDESRLTDADGDGWPEYTPPRNGNKTSGMPPYVYFDPPSYQYKDDQGQFPCYACYPGSLAYGATSPTPVGATSSFLRRVNDWGFATPYATQLTSGLPSAWWNPKKFQIISSGLDAEYGGSQYETAGMGRSPISGSTAIPAVPQTSSQPPAQNLTDGDNDNLTNFISGKLEDFVPQ